MAPNRSYSLLAIFAFLLAISVPAAAQFDVTSVRVLTADTKAPIAGAMVDLYRTDNGTKLSGTTDKSGTASFAGTAAAAIYIVVASAPKFDPNYIPQVRAGQAGIVLSLAVGSGKRPTAEEVKSALATLGTGQGSQSTQTAQLTEEQKAAMQKEKEAIAAIEAKNARSKADSETAQRLINEGIAAAEAKDYTLAIAKYDEGITLIPAFVGITPRFLINRGAILNERAAVEYNKIVAAKDIPQKEKEAQLARVEKDFAESAVSYLKAWEMVKDPSTNPTYGKTMEGFRSEVIAKSFSTFRIAAQAKRVGPSIIDPAKAILGAYVEKESDTVKKAEGSVILGDLLYQGGAYDDSIVEYRKALAIAPDNPDALFGISIALITSGAEKEDKVKYQEAANHLAKFETVAKANPKYAALVAEVPGQLAALKAADVVPEKSAKAPATRKRP